MKKLEINIINPYPIFEKNLKNYKSRVKVRNIILCQKTTFSDITSVTFTNYLGIEK